MLSVEAEAYDRWVVLRGIAEDIAVDNAITIGILSDYLPVEYIDEWFWQQEFDNREWLWSYYEEGKAEQRFDYTAEELFIWAHEFMKENKL